MGSFLYARCRRSVGLPPIPNGPGMSDIGPDRSLAAENLRGGTLAEAAFHTGAPARAHLLVLFIRRLTAREGEIRPIRHSADFNPKLVGEDELRLAS